jgi:nitronate monooxygenase
VFFDQQKLPGPTVTDVTHADETTARSAYVASDAKSTASCVEKMMETALRSGLRPLLLGGRKLLPIVQGGKGVGVSAHRLAGSVASMGAMGTIASVDLRHHHPDLLERTASLPVAAESKRIIDDANLEALSREIRMARELSHGNGLLAVNVMRAVTEYVASVQRAAITPCAVLTSAEEEIGLKTGIHAIFS